MAPVAQSKPPPIQSLSLWTLMDHLLRCPVILLSTSFIILGVFVVRHVQHSRRQQYDQNRPPTSEYHLVDEKQYDIHPTLSDLPPPLQSVVTSGTLAEALNEYRSLNASNNPFPTLTPTMGPWRRHSYPSPLDTDLAVTQITSDETSYYPILDNSSTQRPGKWRRRTLIFEGPPQAVQGPVDSNVSLLLSLDSDQQVHPDNTAVGGMSSDRQT